MFVFDTAALLTAHREPRTTPPARGLRRLTGGLTGRLLAAAAAHRELTQRGLALPRPAGCGWLPRRAWRRHGALICLRAGVDPDAAPKKGTAPEDASW
ncbi:hypothetical protein CKO31_19025 [Thiohalocapsa halophila]|uniref:Type II toxin-antitoxin system VapC family toxin n=1 Tax=Thiohalocapsa halophila TaxID=69359 RepID=A0ABS1CN75_9GAMM|nr:hypothetical protein [Thiohalocapsa halophila]MBK1632801.1 hypothetical protein [Thiohalocapsa halophila]